MHRRILLLTLIASAGALQADLIVAPNANAAANGNAGTIIVFGEGTDPSTFQWQIAGAQLTAMAGDTVTGIAFRLSSQAPSVAAGTSIGSWDLELSSAVNGLGGLSTTFADNIGPHATTVYNSSLTLPALTSGAGPNPFFVIPLMTPYNYTGGDLLMTLVVQNANLLPDIDGNTVDSIVNTVGQLVGDGTPRIGYYDYPITEFQFTSATSTSPTPEPALPLLSLSAGLVLILVHRARRKQSNRI